MAVLAGKRLAWQFFEQTNMRSLAHWAVSHGRIYDLVQFLLGRSVSARRLRHYVAQTAGASVLDLGAGTGHMRDLVPASAKYVWLDCDVQKLRTFRKKHPLDPAVFSDATRLCIRDKSVDYATCVAVTHHLSDLELHLLFSEIARVVRKRLIFLDALWRDTSRISRLLWKYDRGSYPRTVDELSSALERWFKIENSERYSIHHEYLLCTATPRNEAGKPPGSPIVQSWRKPEGNLSRR